MAKVWCNVRFEGEIMMLIERGDNLNLEGAEVERKAIEKEVNASIWLSVNNGRVVFDSNEEKAQ